MVFVVAADLPMAAIAVVTLAADVVANKGGGMVEGKAADSDEFAATGLLFIFALPIVSK